jgi:hypothetical protein
MLQISFSFFPHFWLELDCRDRECWNVMITENTETKIYERAWLLQDILLQGFPVRLSYNRNITSQVQIRGENGKIL